MKKLAILSAVVTLIVSFAIFSEGTAKTASVSPSGSGVARTGLTISWDAVLGASSYDAFVDNNTSFASPELQRLSHTSTSFQQGTQIGDVSPLNASTTYYIKVIPKDSEGKVMEDEIQTGNFSTVD